MTPEEQLRRRMESLDSDVSTSREHDAAILAAAARAAERIRARARPAQPVRTWWVPASIAASFVLGMLVMRGVAMLGGVGDIQTSLTIPVDAVRGAGAATEIPVEQADPDEWFLYIQELIAAGEAREAERHLKRFNELHPDFQYQP